MLLAAVPLRLLAHILLLNAAFTSGSWIRTHGTRPPPQMSHRQLSSAVDDYCDAYGIVGDAAVAMIVEPTELSVGVRVINILTGEDETWYDNALERVVIEYCHEDHKSTRSRYVTSQNITAAKDHYGDCIQTSDGNKDAYAAGLCEVMANCYWASPLEGQDRNRRYTDAQYLSADNAAQEHVKNRMANYGSLGFVMAVVTFIGCVKFAVTRGIYGKCLCEGDLQRERVGYTATEQWTPVATYFIGFLLVVVGGTLGLKGEQCITSGLNTMFTTIDGAYVGLQDLVSLVSLLLNSFVQSIDEVKTEVEIMLARANWLSDLEHGLRLRLSAFEGAHGHRFKGRSVEFDALALDMINVGSAFVSGIVGNLSLAIDVLQEDFLDLEELFSGLGGNVLAGLEVINGTAADSRNRLSYFRQLSDGYADVRRIGMVALIGSVVAVGMIGMIGIGAGISTNKTFMPCVNLLRTTCIIASPAIWLAFVLSAISMVAAVIWSDGCHFLDIGARQGWEMVGLDHQSAFILDQCLAGEAVLDAFNLTDSLGFVEKYAAVVLKLETLNETATAEGTKAAIYALSDFVESLNITEIAVSTLDFYTNAGVNGSLLLDPDCPYNVSFAFEDSIEFLGRPWLVTTGITVDATTPWEAGGAHQSFGRQGNESAMSYMSRVFNSSECSLNDDLLSAWSQALLERATQDQMKADLVCISGQDDTSISTYCSSANPTSTSSTIDPLSTISSVSTSPTLDVSLCGCTSENYTRGGISDTLLEHVETYIVNATNIRAGFTNLFNVSSSFFASLGLDLTSSAGITYATEGGERDGGVLGNLAAITVLARCASRCSFLTSRYTILEGSMCSTVLSGLSQLGFATLVFGIGGLGLVVSASIMVHRLKAEWASNMAKVLSTEEGIVMEEY